MTPSPVPSPDQQPTVTFLRADARRIPLASQSVDLIVTSPPYWRKRDYGFVEQIGQEQTVTDYIDSLVRALNEWKRVLKSSGSLFINLGDTYRGGRLAGMPSRFEIAAVDNGWVVKNRIVWAKRGGIPEPSQRKLASRHEYIFHLVLDERNYYYDLFGLAERISEGSNPGDVWRLRRERRNNEHLAPFPSELVERAITLACPSVVCSCCGAASTRLVRRTTRLNVKRPQARRAMELFQQHGLSEAHILAIQATGISDAGKSLHFQNGAGQNSEEVQRLAREAKKALGGYFREFTFPVRETTGWHTCDCNCMTIPGVVLDPFVGTGTTLSVAHKLGRSAIGSDLVQYSSLSDLLATLSA